MTDISPTKRLALDIIDEHDLNARLPVVEERVWMLKTRHMSDNRIRAIITEEFRDSPAPDADDTPIVVESLPPELDRDIDDWR